MLLRRRPSELGRRLQHQWTARQAAVTSERSREEQQQQRHTPPPPRPAPRTSDDAAAYPRQAPAAVARSCCSAHDLCSPNFRTEWRNLLLPAQFRSRHHLNFGPGRPASELLLPAQHQHQQRCGISTSSQCNAGEEEGPVRSPLSQAPGPLQGSGGQKMGVSSTRTAHSVLTGIRQSPQKLNLVAEMVRGMRVEDALTQMAVSVKRAAKTVSKVVHSAQANAVHNFGLEKDRLVVSEAFVGKDQYLKRIRPHGKGKAGKLEHARARLTVVVKEMSAEQETDLARLRVCRMRGARMSRAQARLVPHRVLATQWSRQRLPVAAVAVAAAAVADGAEL